MPINDESLAVALRPAKWLVPSLSLLLFVVWLIPVPASWKGIASYVPIHITLETFSIVVSMLIFGVAWNAYSSERPSNIIILACGLLVTGLIDFAHMLSFAGMPTWVTPADPEKAINFWLAARIMFSLTLYIVALHKWEAFLRPASRYVVLFAMLVTILAVCWVCLYRQNLLPHTFVPGKGLTPIKILIEYIIVVALLIVSFMFWRQLRQTSARRQELAGLFTTALITAVSELCFTLYADVTDLFNLLGHIYKVIAYMMLYRTVFISSVHEPFQRVRETEAILRKNEARLEELVAERTAQLSEAMQRAEAANSAKSVFLASMSHELRTPLNAILGFSRLMYNSTDVNKEQTENLGIIVHSGEHLLNLINNVLDISKIEAGRMELEETNTDLHHLLHEILSMLDVQAAARGLNFHLQIAENLPRQVVLDSGKLRQVLINLVGNAIKFTAKGEIVLRAESRGRENSAQLWLYFAVKDTGTGISAEDQKRLFTPFVQLGDASTTAGGTGLGLAISRQFVSLMRGSLEVKSTLGQGTEFYFEIPAQLSSVPERDDKEALGSVLGLEPGQPHYRLLVAEDQTENLLLLHRLLEPLGFELHDATTGLQAVEQFQVWLPDLIFMDIRMPVMDGMEATRRIRADAAGSKVRIVALTAHAFEDERLKILEAGCDDLIQKPYRENEIFNALSKYLGVNFRYGKPREEGEDMSSSTTMFDRLQQMPLELLQELLQAVKLLDQEHCLKVAGQISDIDHALGKQLRNLVEGLQYRKLLDLLDDIIGVQHS